jgi:hypothetical protein
METVDFTLPVGTEILRSAPIPSYAWHLHDESSQGSGVATFCCYSFVGATAALPQPLAIIHTAYDWWKFQGLLARWREERGATSSITEAAQCDAYMRIVGMGERAIPLILRQMESEGDEPDQWFWALQILTEADPVPDEERGDYAAMARTWLDWAFRNWYLL